MRPTYRPHSFFFIFDDLSVLKRQKPLGCLFQPRSGGTGFFHMSAKHLRPLFAFREEILVTIILTPLTLINGLGVSRVTSRRQRYNSIF